MELVSGGVVEYNCPNKIYKDYKMDTIEYKYFSRWVKSVLNRGTVFLIVNPGSYKNVSGG